MVVPLSARTDATGSGPAGEWRIPTRILLDNSLIAIVEPEQFEEREQREVPAARDGVRGGPLASSGASLQ
jgi:hypothetical protein